jgi:hypothetical protein
VGPSERPLGHLGCMLEKDLGDPILFFFFFLLPYHEVSGFCSTTVSCHNVLPCHRPKRKEVSQSSTVRIDR